MRLQPVILAGGSGSRLWPLSRQDMPKQFLPLMGERSLLQDTALRLAGLDGCVPPMVVCNEAHRFLVLDQLRQVNVEPAAVVLEPAGRNTAPALALAAGEALRSDANGGPPLLLAMPADHAIADVDGFRAAVRTGAAAAAQGCLVTFGVTPQSPETGFGYIRTGPASAQGARPLLQFVEKPDEATAQAFLTSGDYLWNSGMFLTPADLWLAELERSRPDIAQACARAMAGASYAAPFVRPDADAWAACPAESIDYAVMERAGRSEPSGDAPRYAVVPLDVGWSDVGAWSAVWAMGSHDAAGNRTQGDVFLRDTRDSLLLSRRRLLAGIGLQDMVVVETADAVLVAPRDRAQEVKQVVESLGQAGRPEPDAYPNVHRPWGAFMVIDSGPGFQVKRLTVHPGAAISLQYHHQRAEQWTVVRGEATVTRGDDTFALAEGGSIDIPVGAVHRMENRGEGPLEVIEVQRGAYLGEDDIVRLDDKYGRHVDEAAQRRGR